MSEIRIVRNDIFDRLKEQDSLIEDESLVREPLIRIVKEQIKNEEKTIEAAIDKALQTTDHGVLITRNVITWGLISVEPDESVPYGEIHERRIE